MRNANLYSRLTDCFPVDTDRPFMITRDRHVSYGELRQRAGNIAACLRDAGLKPGDRLAAQIEKSLTGVALYFACLQAGIIYIPLNTSYKSRELEFFFNDAAPRAVVCDPSAEDAVRTMVAGIGSIVVWTAGSDGAGSLEDQLPEHELDVPHLSDGNDPAAMIYTSGTTGRPKGALVTHDNLWSNALALQRVWDINSRDVLLHALPVYHAHGLFTALHPILAAGARVIFHDRFDLGAICRDLPRTTVFMGVPTHYARLLDHPEFDRETAQNVRLFISGSAPLGVELADRFNERTGHAILERYGSTEAMIITSNPLHGERRAGTVGLPLPGIDVRFLTSDGVFAGTGEIGRLQVKGPNVFSGYWRMEAATQDALSSDGYFSVGDLGFRDADGYITLVARESDLIISGGMNVYPKEVEAVVEQAPGVAEASVVGVADAEYGEIVVAVVVPDSGSAGDDLEARVAAHARAQLAGYKNPKRVVTMNSLPRNAMGKVLKTRLREAIGDADTSAPNR